MSRVPLLLKVNGETVEPVGRVCRLNGRLAYVCNVDIPQVAGVMTTSVIPCPFCSAHTAELVSLFGSQLLLSQYRCTTCGSYFEGVRHDCWENEPVAPATGGINDDDGSRPER
ncbi:MAG: hypothetical protein LC797_18455 [Chloroflexi bacterium]|nr:hypothetical protein [Chloroflexota bacterium]